MLKNIHTEKQNVNIEKAWTIDGRNKYKFRDSDAILEIRSSDDFKKLLSQDNMGLGQESKWSSKQLSRRSISHQ